MAVDICGSLDMDWYGRQRHRSREDGRISLDETILKVISLDELLMPPVAKEALESHRLTLWQQLE